LLLHRNDPNQESCQDAGDGNPGACPISETIDMKAPEDGLAPESVTVAIACNRLLAVSCGENNGDCFIYDISNIDDSVDPVLKKVFNLSPASENKSPGLAYDDKTLGDLDAEVVLFVPPEESPTGKAALMFGGAHSGTLSFWEFECENDVKAVDTLFVGESAGSSTGSDGLSSGAKAGIAIGAVVGVCAAAFVATKFYFHRSSTKSKHIEYDTGKASNGGVAWRAESLVVAKAHVYFLVT